jgi:hypothetical protein
LRANAEHLEVEYYKSEKVPESLDPEESGPFSDLQYYFIFISFLCSKEHLLF